MRASPLALARTFLFVPADRPERYARALEADADVVIVDLEDAVTPDNKLSARSQLTQGLLSMPESERARIVVRVNARGTPWHDDDSALMGRLCAMGLGGVMVPKSEDADALAAMAAVIGPTTSVLPLIESAAGLAALDAIAQAPKVQRLAFGHLDFQADLGMSCDADETELVPVRLAIVLASRRAQLAAPVDGVTADWRNLERLASDARRARRGGFGGKLCIHPKQVAVVREELQPSADEVHWAKRVVQAAQDARGGAVSLDGRMIDAPVVKIAERLLALKAGG